MSEGRQDSAMHLSSAVVSVLPAKRAHVATQLSAMPGIEVHQQNESKIIIVLEARDSGVIGGKLAEIAGMDGVLSANMAAEHAAVPRKAQTAVRTFPARYPESAGRCRRRRSCRHRPACRCTAPGGWHRRA